MKRRVLAFMLFAAIVPGCATDGGSSVGVGFYGDWYYADDVWYGGGCCVDRPDDVPHPEHPIVLPPDGVGPPRPEQPIALPPKAEPKSASPSTSSSMRSAAPRASMSMGGGGRGGGRR
jgi:hypothetical protein